MNEPRHTTLEGVIGDVIDRRLAGQILPDEQIVAEFPELMPELAAELSKLRAVQEAGRPAWQGDRASAPPGSDAGALSSTRAAESDLPNGPTLHERRLIEGARAGVADAETEPDRPRPRAIPGYEILRELGPGGQGVVYLALQQSTQREVAIKVMKSGPFADAGERVRFEREVQILGQLRHPNIVTIHDSGTADGCQYFVMNYIPGAPLDKHVREHKPDPRAILSLFVTICEAVNAAHLRGVIHRDLKPGNILVDEAGQPHVLDFGLAKVDDDSSDAANLTLTGQFLGTPLWASPEQAARRPTVLDLRTDVYSLGVILYQLLTGRFPYDVGGGVRDVLDRIAQDDPVRPRSISRTVNDEIETILLTCLAKEPERRYQSAGALAAEIERYLSGRPIEAKRDRWYVLRKNLRRYRVAVATAAAFVLVLIGATVTSTAFYLRAEDNLVLAKQRADELQIVSDFQASMLAETDAEGMGLAIVDGFEDRIRAALAERIEDQAELDQVMHEWRQQTLRGSPTTVALGVLDEFVLARAARTIETQFADQPLVRAALQQTVADTYREIGFYDPALPLQEAALETRRRVLGDDHPVTLGSINNMGYLLESMGKLEEALAQFRAALEGRRHVLGDDHLETLESINNMGVLLSAMGRLDDARGYDSEALEGRRRVLGDDHPETLTSVNNMGYLLQSMGRLEEALPYYREAMESRRRVLGDDDPHTLTSIGNMGLLLESMGKLHEAEPYYREALEGRRRVLGDNHPHTLTSINNMGYLLGSMGKLDEAQGYYREALDGSRRVLGDDHPDTLGSINNMGDLLQSMGKLDEALVYVREALEGCCRVLGEDHSYTLTSLNNVGFLLQRTGKPEESLAYYREALEGFRRVLGDDHPSTLASIHNIGFLLSTMGKLDDAERYYREALKRRRRVLGDDHPDTLTSTHNMGYLLQSMGKLDEAKGYYREALESRRRVQGDDHPDTLISIHNMGGLLRDLGTLDEAEVLGAEAVRGARANFAPLHVFRLAAIAEYGRTLAALKRFDEAQDELLEAHRGMVESLGPDHERAKRVVEALIDLYDAWHAAEPDAGHDAKAAEWRAALKRD